MVIKQGFVPQVLLKICYAIWQGRSDAAVQKTRKKIIVDEQNI